MSPGRTRLKAIQLPVSLVDLTPAAQALTGAGPIVRAAEAGLQVWASPPLSGGELIGMISAELAELIHPGLSPAQVALAVVASTPHLSGALLSASTAAHWQEARGVFARPPITPVHLQEICRVLRT